MFSLSFLSLWKFFPGGISEVSFLSDTCTTTAAADTWAGMPNTHCILHTALISAWIIMDVALTTHHAIGNYLFGGGNWATGFHSHFDLIFSAGLKNKQWPRLCFLLQSSASSEWRLASKALTPQNFFYQIVSNSATHPTFFSIKTHVVSFIAHEDQICLCIGGIYRNKKSVCRARRRACKVIPRKAWLQE